ncbi:hypothetical protein [Dyella sp.]|uniref:hypothetical protein n=1 Tax=Dyella sp. TaxID=1869338 RepID=UPI002FDB5809
MALNLSTAFKQLLLGPHAFADIFKNGAIRVFAGTQPSSADAAEVGTLLGVITNQGAPWVAGQPANGLEFQLFGSSMSIALGQNWRLSAALSGTAGWFRLVANGVDGGGDSLTLPRIDGAIGTTSAPAEMILAQPLLTAGVQYPINAFVFALPPL